MVRLWKWEKLSRVFNHQRPTACRKGEEKMNIILESTGCFLFFFLEHFLLAGNSYYYRHRQSPNFAFLAAKACHYFFCNYGVLTFVWWIHAKALLCIWVKKKKNPKLSRSYNVMYSRLVKCKSSKKINFWANALFSSKNALSTTFVTQKIALSVMPFSIIQ